jgi:hypothetical protein
MTLSIATLNTDTISSFMLIVVRLNVSYSECLSASLNASVVTIITLSIMLSIIMISVIMVIVTLSVTTREYVMMLHLKVRLVLYA